MVAEASHIPSLDTISFPFRDTDAGLLGKLFVEDSHLGNGYYKTVNGKAIMIHLGADRFAIGSYGTPVTLEPIVGGVADKDAQAAFQIEQFWFGDIQAINGLSAMDRTFLLRTQQVPDQYKMKQESIRFAHSLGDALHIIRKTPDQILPRDYKQFMLLAILTKATLALEQFHSLNLSLHLGGESHLVHNDVGQRDHLDNFLLSALDDIPSLLIDLSHTKETTHNYELRNEMQTYTRQVMNELIDDDNGSIPMGLLPLLPREILSDLQRGTALNSAKLRAAARASLESIVQTRRFPSPMQALSYTNHRYFLSYLHQVILNQTQGKRSLNPKTLESIAEGIQDLYSESPTMMMDTYGLRPPKIA